METERITVRDPAGGRYTILKVQPHRTETTLDGTVLRHPLLPYYQLTDGRLVNRQGDGTYLIVQTGTVLMP